MVFVNVTLSALEIRLPPLLILVNTEFDTETFDTGDCESPTISTAASFEPFIVRLSSVMLRTVGYATGPGPELEYLSVMKIGDLVNLFR